jgi:hypothetical protein
VSEPNKIEISLGPGGRGSVKLGGVELNRYTDGVSIESHIHSGTRILISVADPDSLELVVDDPAAEILRALPVEEKEDDR